MKPTQRILVFTALLAMAVPPVLAIGQGTAGSTAARQQVQTRWEQQAEQAFNLSRGQGRQLMNQEEWQEHRQKMQSMTSEERERYRQEVHQRMVERATESSVRVQEAPGPRGPMGGSGSGGRGAGGGRGR